MEHKKEYIVLSISSISVIHKR